MRVVAPLLLLVASGCPVQTGPKYASFEPVQVKSLDLIFVGGANTYCPHGQPEQLKAVVTLADGKTLQTYARGGSREGTLEFSRFEFSSSLGNIDAEGRLHVPADPFVAVGRSITVKARVVGRPEIEASTTIRPTFDCGGSFGAAGQSGAFGRAGLAGRPGRDGRSATSSSAAEDGTDGEDGGHGGNGGDGGPGPDIDVALTYVDADDHGRLMLIKLGSRWVLADPAGPPIAIYAIGGSGGPGGSGGSGGRGGRGGSATGKDTGDGGNGANGGNGGDGGDGGNGGDGGSIRVLVDARFPELVDKLRFSTGGGAAGSAGSSGFGGGAGTGGSSSSGRSGQSGRAGRSGQSGRRGQPGRSGRGVEVQKLPVDTLFADEIRRGLPIVAE